MEFIYLILIMAAGAVGMAFWLKVIGPQKNASQPLIKDDPEVDETIEAYFASLHKSPPGITATRKRFKLGASNSGYYIRDTTHRNFCSHILCRCWYTAGANRELAEELIQLLNEAKNPIVTQPEPNVIVVNWNEHTEGDEQIWIDTFNFNK